VRAVAPEAEHIDVARGDTRAAREDPPEVSLRVRGELLEAVWEKSTAGRFGKVDEDMLGCVRFFFEQGHGLVGWERLIRGRGAYGVRATPYVVSCFGRSIRVAQALQIYGGGCVAQAILL